MRAEARNSRDAICLSGRPRTDPRMCCDEIVSGDSGPTWSVSDLMNFSPVDIMPVPVAL